MADEAADLGLLEDGGGVDEGAGDEGGGEEEQMPDDTGTGDEGEGGDDEGGEPPDDEEGEPAGKTFPTQLRKALREFSAGNPDFARKYPQLERQLTAALYKAGQIDKSGGLQQLRQAAQLLETHGGQQGLEEMAEEVEAVRTMEQGFQQGDPVLVDTWAQQYPDGFKQLVGPAIAKLEGLDLAAHDRALSGPMLKTLDRCGVLGTMADLETAIAGERFEDIQKYYGALKNFFLELKDFAGKARNAPDHFKADREKLEAERTEFQTERQKAFRGDVSNAVNGEVMAFTNRLLRQALAGKKLRVETANRVRAQIHDDLEQALRAHARDRASGYADRYKQAAEAGDKVRLTNLIVGASKKKLPVIVKNILRDLNLGGSQTMRSGASSNGRRRLGGGGTSTVAGRPKTDDVDFNRTDKARYLGMISSGHGQAYLKNGKIARW